MGRSNKEFQQSALFHGTAHPFRKGDIVVPGNDGYAYATPDIKYAQYRAEQAVPFLWEDLKKQNPTWNKPGGKQYDEFAQENPPRIFQVEPIDEIESTDNTGGDKGNVMSKKGFRVVKQVK
jgi:hypothetical protein